MSQNGHQRKDADYRLTIRLASRTAHFNVLCAGRPDYAEPVSLVILGPA